MRPTSVRADSTQNCDVVEGEFQTAEESLSVLANAIRVVSDGAVYRSPRIAENLRRAKEVGLTAAHCLVLRLYSDGYDGYTLGKQLCEFMGWNPERSLGRKANELLNEAKEIVGLSELPKDALLVGIHNLIDKGQI